MTAGRDAGKARDMTAPRQARESAWSLLEIVAQSNAWAGKVVRVSQLAPAFAASPSLSLKAGIAYAVGQGWIRDWGRAVVLTEKGLAANVARLERRCEPPAATAEGATTTTTTTTGATGIAAGFDRAFRSIVIPPRPAAKKPTRKRG
jgi:hypothetical protein